VCHAWSCARWRCSRSMRPFAECVARPTHIVLMANFQVNLALTFLPFLFLTSVWHRRDTTSLISFKFSLTDWQRPNQDVRGKLSAWYHGMLSNRTSLPSSFNLCTSSYTLDPISIKFTFNISKPSQYNLLTQLWFKNWSYFYNL